VLWGFWIAESLEMLIYCGVLYFSAGPGDPSQQRRSWVFPQADFTLKLRFAKQRGSLLLALKQMDIDPIILNWTFNQEVKSRMWQGIACFPGQFFQNLANAITGKASVAVP
jgi:hypothetical protein